jgi:hypothetical protein
MRKDDSNILFFILRELSCNNFFCSEKLLIFFFVLFMLSACHNAGNKTTSINKATVKDNPAIAKTQLTDTISTLAADKKTNTGNTTVSTTSALQKENNSTDITLLYATLQKWHGGVKGSGGGTNYEIFIHVPHLTNINFDELWIGQVLHETMWRRQPAASDTIVVRASDYQKDPSNRNIPELDSSQTSLNKTPSTSPPPFAYTGAALLGYKYGEQRMYKIITSFKVKPTLNYP